MADSLFDNRYRYDYIYPRGRSGETLRAVDTQANDRPVVIKRPAPNDAPPIRAGQEVSIINERRALARLGGHPALTELVGEGQFTVGGMTHQYIVVERAEGEVIADKVLALAAKGERLPELEMLVIVDRLLDLLQFAHSRDIVYNDVDAKHLFWDRNNYRLKVIDWGNAVFLEGEEITAQGVSRQSDIFQIGELLYFVLTGGSRADVPRSAGAEFAADFGDNAEYVAPRLQAIVSRALHPNPKLRYPFINELRRELADYRQPLERERDGIIARVAERLRRNLSKNELQTLQTTLDNARAFDPGYPAIQQTQRDIYQRLHGLEVESGLDVARIYLESANWPKAVETLSELRDQTPPGELATKIALLLDCALLMLDGSPENLREPSPAVHEAFGLMFENEFSEAANVLLTYDTENDIDRKLQWLMAERVSSHVPEVLLLRPNLYRLELALATLAGEGYSVGEVRGLLREIRDTLNSMANQSNIAVLRDRYREVVDRLTALNALLSTLMVQHNLSNRKLPLNSLDRALNAAMALADNMHVIGKQSTGSPRDATAALDSSRGIDPTSPVWDRLGMFLNNLYALLQSYQTFVPVADGSDLEAWLSDARRELEPYRSALFDEMLDSMARGLEVALKSWKDYADHAVQGDRNSAVVALADATDAVTTISPTLAGWLNQLRVIVEGARYVERHAMYGGLGRALADGWQMFDRGRLGEAERLGQQAYEIARTERERFAANRLYQLSQLSRDWVERNAANSEARTRAAIDAVEALYTESENKTRKSFNAQMPSRETYLKAMGKGIVEIYARSSTASTRILAINYALYGTLDAHADLLDNVPFWREAALRAFGEDGSQHIVIRTLDEFAQRRRDILQAAERINGLNTPAAMETVDQVRRMVEESPQAKLLTSAVQSLRDLEVALRDWSEGEFRSAGLKIESAQNAIADAEQTVPFKVSDYRAWLGMLQANAAELHVQMRNLRTDVENRVSTPTESLLNAHRKIASTTQRMLGDKLAAPLVQWRDTYERFLSIYSDDAIRRSRKLDLLNEQFRALFIDRHPAYMLYRHWYEVVDRSPEFPAPPTDEPTPQIAEVDDDIDVNAPPPGPKPSKYADDDEEEPRARRRPRWWLFGGILGIVAVIGVLAIATGRQPPPAVDIAVTISATPDEAENAAFTATIEAAAVQAAAVATTPAPAVEAETATTAPTDTEQPAIPTETSEPSATPTLTPTATFTPSATFTPTATFTPSATFTATATPTATLPPQGLQGQQDLLALLSRLSPDEITWDSELFSIGTDGRFWRLGTGGQDDGTEFTIGLSPELLEKYYGSGAAGRIRRVEAIISLLTADPLLPPEEVYFGVMLMSPQDADDFENRGVQVQAISLTSINIYQRINDERVLIDDQNVNAVLGRLRVDRDTATGVVTTYFNDTPIGQTVQLPSPDAPLIPVLYIRKGGVVASVTNWRITLR